MTSQDETDLTGERFAAADHTPILFSQEDKTWGVVMKAPFANDKGEEQSVLHIDHCVDLTP